MTTALKGAGVNLLLAIVWGLFLGEVRALKLTGYFLWELLRANLHMALLALRARPRLNPLIAGVPLSLTGDVPLGFSPDRRALYVHALGMRDVQAARSSVRDVERRLLRFTDGPDTR